MIPHFVPPDRWLDRCSPYVESFRLSTREVKVGEHSVVPAERQNLSDVLLRRYVRQLHCLPSH